MYSDEPWEIPLVKDALKDELRPISKVVDGATRHINPYPFPWIAVQRMFMAPIVVLFMALGPRVTGQAVGINAANPRQWGDLLDYLMELASEGEDWKTGGVFCDLDAVLYDAGLQQDLFVRLAAPVLYKLAKRMGWSERDARALRRLITLYPVFLLDLDSVLCEIWC